MNSTEFKKRCMDKIYRYRNTDKTRWGIAGDISVNDIEELLIKQNYTCYVCKEAVLLESWTKCCLYQFSIDRINENLPHDRDNFLISCFHCNSTLYTREDAEKKICIHGCHTEEKIFKMNRIDVLPLMEHLRLSKNTDRDIQLKKAYQLKYETMKLIFDKRVGEFRKKIFKFLLEKRILFQRLFAMFEEGTKRNYAPTNEFMNELFELRMSMRDSMKTYMYFSDTVIRSFHEWYTEIQKKKESGYPLIEIYPISVTIHNVNESRLKSKIKNRIEKEFQNIYKRGIFELNPVCLINRLGLNEYFSFSYS
jgi:hypothetical protein